MDNPTIEKWYNDLDRFTRKENLVNGKNKYDEIMKQYQQFLKHNKNKK